MGEDKLERGIWQCRVCEDHYHGDNKYDVCHNCVDTILSVIQKNLSSWRSRCLRCDSFVHVKHLNHGFCPSCAEGYILNAIKETKES